LSDWLASRFPTLNGRIRIKTLLRFHLQYKTYDADWQHGQIPVMAVVFGIESGLLSFYTGPSITVHRDTKA